MFQIQTISAAKTGEGIKLVALSGSVILLATILISLVLISIPAPVQADTYIGGNMQCSATAANEICNSRFNIDTMQAEQYNCQPCTLPAGTQRQTTCPDGRTVIASVACIPNVGSDATCGLDPNACSAGGLISVNEPNVVYTFPVYK